MCKLCCFTKVPQSLTVFQRQDSLCSKAQRCALRVSSITANTYLIFLGLVGIALTPSPYIPFTLAQQHDADEVVGLINKESSNSEAALSLVQDKEDESGEEYSAVVDWPFHRNSSSDIDNTKKTENGNSSNTSNACADTTTCDACNSFHTCHWCAHDSACHAIGSFHGCLIGSTCESHKHKPAHNETDPSGCLAHDSCSECTLASHLCHWCAHDNACHAVGSIYGCVTGVDCYDNTHCKRIKPEPWPWNEDNSIKTMGMLPLLMIGTISGIILCCATVCCCITGGLKEAYDDLADLAESPFLEQQHENGAQGVASLRASFEPLTTESRCERQRVKTRSSSRQTAAAKAAAAAVATGDEVTMAQPKTELDWAKIQLPKPQATTKALLRGMKCSPCWNLERKQLRTTMFA